MIVPLPHSAQSLKALLKDTPDTVIGMDKLSKTERTELLVMACANVIVHTLSIMSCGNKAKALDGLDNLVGDMREAITELCPDRG